MSIHEYSSDYLPGSDSFKKLIIVFDKEKEVPLWMFVPTCAEEEYILLHPHAEILVPFSMDTVSPGTGEIAVLLSEDCLITGQLSHFSFSVN